MFQHKKFSQDFKRFKTQYLDGETLDQNTIQEYLKTLATVNLKTLQEDKAKIAFWINVYNGLTNYWIIKKGIQKNMLEKPFLVMRSKVIIGGHSFSLDDIEHGILRKNRKSLYKLFKQFSGRDSRRELIVDQLDYRIHFALNCGAKSCPPIAYYDEHFLDQQLKIAEESFVEQDFLVDTTSKTIHCSKIFWLYKKDFQQVYINAPQYKNYKIRYRKYDFSVH